MRTGLPNGLQTLLNMLGLKGGQEAGAHGAAVDKQGLEGAHGKDQKGIAKGEVLGEEGQVLAGLGYNPADKQAQAKNVAEKANVERFMQDVSGEKDRPQLIDKKEGDGFLSDKNDKTDAQDRLDREGNEAKLARDEQRLDDRIDDGRAQAFQEAKQEKEQREVGESKEQKREEDRDRDDGRDDDREKHGTPWIQEEIDREHERKRRRGVRLDDALGAQTRCHGTLDDGSRCLRRPMPGTPYCREHAAGVR